MNFINPIRRGETTADYGISSKQAVRETYAKFADVFLLMFSVFNIISISSVNLGDYSWVASLIHGDFSTFTTIILNTFTSKILSFDKDVFVNTGLLFLICVSVAKFINPVAAIKELYSEAFSFLAHLADKANWLQKTAVIGLLINLFTIFFQFDQTTSFVLFFIFFLSAAPLVVYSLTQGANTVLGSVVDYIENVQYKHIEIGFLGLLIFNLYLTFTDSPYLCLLYTVIWAIFYLCEKSKSLQSAGNIIFLTIGIIIVGSMLIPSGLIMAAAGAFIVIVNNVISKKVGKDVITIERIHSSMAIMGFVLFLLMFS